MRKTLLVTGITGALAIGGTSAALASTSTPAPSAQSASAQSTSAQSTSAQSVSSQSTVDRRTAAISRASAERIALRQVPGSRVREAELEREHGRLIWDVELLKNRIGYEVEISSGGKVLKVERRSDDHRGRDRNHDRDDDHGHDRGHEQNDDRGHDR